VSQVYTSFSPWSHMGKRLSEKSYKRECKETYRGVDSVPKLFCLGIQPNRLNVHARSTNILVQEVVASFRGSKR
jgi:hypothetical protein